MLVDVIYCTVEERIPLLNAKTRFSRLQESDQSQPALCFAFSQNFEQACWWSCRNLISSLHLIILI